MTRNRILSLKNPFNYNSKAQVASILLNHPADYALKCLENFKFVHIEAAKAVWCSDENEMLAIMQAVKRNVANAKLDHHLSYIEYMFMKNHFLMVIENAKWGNNVIDSYNWFFHNLDNHPL
ncbi:hypothetical protein V8B97DRAFT_2024187 [Scleroderma yunnanense]